MAGVWDFARENANLAPKPGALEHGELAESAWEELDFLAPCVAKVFLLHPCSAPCC